MDTDSVHCWRCGYDVRGIRGDGLCPECSAPVDGTGREQNWRAARSRGLYAFCGVTWLALPANIAIYRWGNVMPHRAAELFVQVWLVLTVVTSVTYVMTAFRWRQSVGVAVACVCTIFGCLLAAMINAAILVIVLLSV